jgi:hypothetical protein
MKQLKHTFETSEILQTYICNKGDEKVEVGRFWSSEWDLAAREHHQHALAPAPVREHNHD